MNPFSPLLLLLVVLFTGQQSQAQLVNDSPSFESLKGRLSLPVDRFTRLDNYEQVLKRCKANEPFSGCGITKSLTIQSDSIMTIKSVAAGKVMAIFEVDNMQAIFIRHGDYYFAYSNLQIVFVKKGEVIMIGQSIGQVLIPSYNGSYELELLMTNKKAQSIDPYPWFIHSPQSTP